MEKISVIIPAYNAEQTIDKCLESILNGTYANIEVVVVNDGSADNTKGKLEQWVKKDNRVKFIDQENKGVSATRNTGLKAATGELIAWCDSDDWVKPDWLESQYNNLKEYDADIAVCRVFRSTEPEVQPELKVSCWDRQTAINKLLIHQEVSGSLVNKLFKAELFEGICFDEQITYFEDDDCFYKMLKKVQRVVVSNKNGYCIFVNPTSLTNTKFNKSRIDALVVWERMYNDCKQNFPELEDCAHASFANWSFITLLLMFRDDYFDKAAEKRLQSNVRSYGVKVCSVIQGLGHKMFLFLVLSSISLSRKVYKTIMRIKGSI